MVVLTQENNALTDGRTLVMLLFVSFILLAVFSCCRISGIESRREERELYERFNR